MTLLFLVMMWQVLVDRLVLQKCKNETVNVKDGRVFNDQKYIRMEMEIDTDEKLEFNVEHIKIGNIKHMCVA